MYINTISTHHIPEETPSPPHRTRPNHNPLPTINIQPPQLPILHPLRPSVPRRSHSDLQRLPHPTSPSTPLNPTPTHSPLRPPLPLSPTHHGTSPPLHLRGRHLQSLSSLERLHAAPIVPPRLLQSTHHMAEVTNSLAILQELGVA